MFLLVVVAVVVVVVVVVIIWVGGEVEEERVVGGKGLMRGLQRSREKRGKRWLRRYHKGLLWSGRL